MKQLIIIILLSLFSTTTFAVENTWCSVNLKDGTRQTYVISGKMIIIPSSTQLTIKSPYFQTTYTLQNVISYNFLSQREIDAIPQSTTPNINILFLSPDEVTIQGITTPQSVRIFSTNGTQYPVNYSETGSQDNNEITISLRSLPTGIYLITLHGANIPPIKVLR